jgi:hypothetical protein
MKMTMHVVAQAEEWRLGSFGHKAEMGFPKSKSYVEVIIGTTCLWLNEMACSSRNSNYNFLL